MWIDLQDVFERIQGTVTDLVATLPNIVAGLVVFMVIYLIARYSGPAVRRLVERSGRSANAATVAALLTRWSVIAFGALVGMAVALPSFAPGDLIQILGIGSVAIGFAFRDIFENFLAGLIILLTDAFQIGDQIVVEGMEGTVARIETRATLIRTYDGRDIIIPNADLFTNAVTVNTAATMRRSEFDFGISYAADLDTALRLVLEAMRGVDGVLDQPGPDALVMEFGDSSVNLRARWWTDARRSSVVASGSAVRRAIKYQLDGHGIEIPFPIRTVYLQNEAAVGEASL
jgi:small-conductance mechanosensitive channel